MQVKRHNLGPSVCTWVKLGKGASAWQVQGGQQWVYCCEDAEQSLFLCYYLLTAALFSIQTTVVRLLSPHPVCSDRHLTIKLPSFLSHTYSPW